MPRRRKRPATDRNAYVLTWGSHDTTEDGGVWSSLDGAQQAAAEHVGIVGWREDRTDGFPTIWYAELAEGEDEFWHAADIIELPFDRDARPPESDDS